MPSRAESFFAVALAALPSCAQCGKSDFVGGTYVVDGELKVLSPRFETDGQTKIVGEAVTVTRTARHYQYASWEITVRGCTVTTDRAGIERAIASGRCTIDGPNGPIPIYAFAEATPTGSDSVEIHVRGPIESEAGPGGSFEYTARGALKR